MAKAKLSALILKGVELDGKAFIGDFFDWDWDREAVHGAPPLGCCALGAAKIGLLSKEFTEELKKFKAGKPADFGFLEKGGSLPLPASYDPLPETLAKKYPALGNVGDLVVHLNDDKKWSRKKIAKLLAKHGL